MASLLIYKTSAMNTAAGETWRYEINNLGSISVVLDQPVSPMALPQEDATENVLVKMEGNTQTITVNWKVGQGFPYPKKSETGNVGISQIQEDYEVFYAGSGSTPITWSDLEYTDPEDTVSWLTNDFEGKDISDRFILVLGHESLRYEGFVTRMTCGIDGNSPVVWNISMTFIVGNVISIYETDAPSECRNVKAELVDNNGDAQENGNTRIKLMWTAPSDTASTITHYAVWIKEQNKSYTSDPSYTFAVTDADGSTHAAFNDELDGHVESGSGRYEISFPDAAGAATNFVKAGSTPAVKIPHTVAEFATLTSGDKYYFKVAAVNLKGGVGFKSNEKTAVLP
jgi:hypothetical protein